MLYIKQKGNIVKIYTVKGLRRALNTSLKIVKLLCEKHLFTYETRVKLAKKYLNIKSKVPIYINDFTLLMPTKSAKAYENIWINYYQIFDYNKFGSKTVILFNNLEEVIISVSIKAFKTMLNKAKLIDNYFKFFIEPI